MIEYILGFCHIVCYVILCILFLDIFAVRRNNKKTKVYILYIVLIGANYFIAIILSSNILIKQIVIIILSSIIAWLIYKQSYIKMLILLMLYQAECIAIEYVTIAVVQYFFELKEEAAQLLGTLCQMLIFCVILVMKKYIVHKGAETLTKIEWIRFSIFPLFTIVSIVTMLIGAKVSYIYISWGLLIMNVIIFTLINDIMKREIQIAENRLFREQIKNETKMYHDISEKYENQRKKVHEFNNHITCILALAQNNEYEKLKSYLSNMQSDIINVSNLIDTNHTLINAILNSKYMEAKQKGIIFVLKINDLANIHLADEDIVVMLSNLLNNAFEACNDCKEKIVKLRFVQKRNHIILSVVNSFDKTPVKLGDKFQTIKAENIEQHGIGIENIKDTVKKYNGICVIRYEDNLFKFTISIPANL